MRVEAAEIRVSNLDQVVDGRICTEDSSNLSISPEMPNGVENPFYPAGFDRLIDTIKVALQESKVKNPL